MAFNRNSFKKDILRLIKTHGSAEGLLTVNTPDNSYVFFILPQTWQDVGERGRLCINDDWESGFWEDYEDSELKKVWMALKSKDLVK